MPHGPESQDYFGYTPTSLDFINRPNPVEPTAAPPKHPLHGSNTLNTGYSHDLRRLLLDSGPQASAKRRKVHDEGSGSGGDNGRDLPKLPARPGSGGRVKRTRLPPTLSGLHQPPPNAGLLPSICVEQPKEQNPSAVAAGTDSNSKRAAENASKSDDSPAKIKTGKPRRNRWSDEETASLLQGVARFGVGNWTKILKCDEYNFTKRTALDLKDRFRVCCPEHYKKPKPTQSGDRARPSENEQSRQAESRPHRRHRKNSAELAQLGIDKPFEQSTRRSRHEWTEPEDAALLKGFKRHGKSWSSIRDDDELHLSHRMPTDLRDRLRQRYPDEYARVGLVSRPEVFPPPPDRATKAESRAAAEISQSSGDEPARHAKLGRTQRTEHSSKRSRDSQTDNNHIQAPPMFLPNDVFFGMPAEDEDFDTEPIVLDRGILDWALDSAKPAHESSHHFGHSVAGSKAPFATRASSSTTAVNNASAALPSLAAITAANDDYDDLELPSLMQYISPLESDGRGSGHGFLSLEDLLQS